ncbi:MAG TPA: hypothetical protein VNZ61_20965 [Roseomonas sp.]|nr:hypothetical protein [Roseomonas sp.]
MITLTSPNPAQYGVLTVSEGDLAQIYITRDDLSQAQDFDIQYRQINLDQSGEFTGINIHNPIHVHWDAGDNTTQVIQLPTTEDNTAAGVPLWYVNFDLVPGAGTTAGGFTSFGEQQDSFQIAIQEDDVPNVAVSLSGGDPGSMFVYVGEGTGLTWHFERTDTSQPMTFELRPTDPSMADAVRWFGYDPAHPLMVHWDAGDTGARDLTVSAVEDHVVAEGNPVVWSLVPRQGVTGFSGPDPQIQNVIHGEDGTTSVLLQFMNDDQQNTIPVARFYNTQTGTHFYTDSAGEAAAVRANLPYMQYEGDGFQSMEHDAAGAVPVWRFFNEATGCHFYTASDSERDWIMQTLPTYRLEGEGFSASHSAGADMTAVYRFYNVETNAHFFTVSPSEMQTVAQTLPQYHYEGVAFYVPADDTVVA